ncbi:MAG: 50S ribosomal protein L5 [Nitrospinaceae bacterium]|nr:50S ribosomal protein L5 [Nitrospinaceae bacterium]NIR55547.1 50S ribosomal protein L5 [Nitrospinaceae bacterium]NIS85981.1 50S ribosomal protein L5 [Nitrospinaceae bacterium]NIT82827.1 50S ribosomal protein L5 [Nitrospinaceae bacterium]NIU45029.1 50S ribosomal protein L5 [Nitrospinaceae bacterium]
MANLKKHYNEKVKPQIQKELGLTNVMQVPRLDKIVINMGLGEALQNSKLIDAGVEQLRIISGQQPVVTRAKKAISNFKLREGVPVGVRVTLRGSRMYEFFERLVGFALPRVRDFKGLSAKAFDGRGNYTLGLKEQLIFPEINFDKIDHVKGMNITICTSAQTDEAGKVLLKSMGFPFRN